MKSAEKYRELVSVAQRLGITVREESFKTTGINAKSGLCRIHGNPVFIMDKRLKTTEKIKILAGCLKEFSIENIYIVPEVRRLIQENDA